MTAANDPHPAPVLDLQQRFEAIGRLSKQDTTPHEFYQRLLSHLGDDTIAVWGVVWIGTAGEWQRAAQIKGHSADAERVIATLGAAAAAEALAAAPPRCYRHSLANGVTLLTLPLERPASVVLQIALQSNEPAGGPAIPTLDVAQQLLQAYGQWGEDFERNRTLRRLQSLLAEQRRLQQFGDSIHRSLELDRTAFSVVAATVTATGCQRASLLVLHRRRLRVAAVSGVATVDRRSPLIHSLQRLAEAVVASGETLEYAGDDRALPPQLADPLNEYLDQSHAVRLWAIPLRAPESPREADGTSNGESDTAHPAGRESGVWPGTVASTGPPLGGVGVNGVLILESADPTAVAPPRGMVDELARQAAIAVQHALAHSTLPLRGVGLAMRRASESSGLGGVPRIAWVSAAIVMVLAGLILIPAELRIHAPGTLEPAWIYNSYAPRSGYVADVWVEHDQAVAAASPLLQIYSPDLELEMRRTEGAIESTEKELRAAEAARRRGDRASSAPQEAGSFAVDETRLRGMLESYQQQLALLHDEHAALAITSPVEGVVLTWQLQQTLMGRPVQRGQRLIQIAAAESPWMLVLEVPDQDAGHILTARREIRPDLPVDFVVATQPQQRHRGTVSKVAQITTMSDAVQPVVELTVQIARDDLPHLRAGAQVRAEIQCGSYPLGYVWFHQLWDAIRSKLWL